MKKRICIYAIALALNCVVLEANNLRISLIIPCSYKHAHLLYPLLKLYERQTVLPDEVIVSLSEANQTPSSIIAQLEKEQWAFSFSMLISNNKQYPGTNRNIACQKATGDVFVCQDADDIPHPQRVEVIKYFFENYDIDHLMHCYFFNGTDQFLHITKKDIAFEYMKNIDSTWQIQYVHYGCPAIRKDVFKHVQWSTDRPSGDDDIIFDTKVYKTFSHCMLIRAQVYVYRNTLSSFGSGYSKSVDTAYWQALYNEFYANYKGMER